MHFLLGSENIWIELVRCTKLLNLEDDEVGERTTTANDTGSEKGVVLIVYKEKGQLFSQQTAIVLDFKRLKMLAQRAFANPITVPSIISIHPWKFCRSKKIVITCCEGRPGARDSLSSQTPQPSYTRRCTKYVATAASRAARRAATSSATETFGVTESGKFTLSDSALRQRGFELVYTAESLSLDQLNTLFVKVGFPRRQKEKLARALEHTLSLVWLRHQKSQTLVAFARATGDAVFNAIIWDVVVDPSFQGLGYGKVVIERLMADLVKKGISNIALYAEPHVVGFYKPLGFIADPDGIRAMAYARRKR